VGWLFHLRPEAEGSGQATGDNSPALADATSVRALGLRGPFRTGLSAVPLARRVEAGSSHACPRLLSTLAQIRSVTVGDLCLGALWDSWQGAEQGGRRKDLFVQEAILIFSARAWSCMRLISEMVPPGERRGRLQTSTVPVT